DAEQMTTTVRGTSWEDLTQLKVGGTLQAALQQVAENAKFKYSRLFAIGLYTLLETLDAEAVKDNERRKMALEKLAMELHLSGDKLEKDLELYRSNLDNMQQAQTAMADILAADRKRREQREQDKGTHAPGEAETAATETTPNEAAVDP
ncbi:MAG: photosystem II biogenesis protein Psp29, partial [Synechococcales bacterium]|nr:photosystem II biogenesis protein Psp29 [Synechococcales bacterium]